MTFFHSRPKAIVPCAQFLSTVLKRRNMNFASANHRPWKPPKLLMLNYFYV